jgi:hypothetical protein
MGLNGAEWGRMGPNGNNHPTTKPQNDGMSTRSPPFMADM